MKKYLFYITIILSVVFVGQKFFNKHTNETSYTSKPLIIGNITESITASGIINPLSTVSIGTQASGRIAEIYVDYNSTVKKGDLLVKDIVTTDYNNEVYVGTFGSVYAYTWYYVTINEKISDYNNESVFANCLLAIKEEISKNFTDNEYIYEENVLKFNIDKNILNMKVHFTCVEDIAKE
jgi:hypothetical protein